METVKNSQQKTSKSSPTTTRHRRKLLDEELSIKNVAKPPMTLWLNGRYRVRNTAENVAEPLQMSAELLTKSVPKLPMMSWLEGEVCGWELRKKNTAKLTRGELKKSLKKDRGKIQD